MTVNILLITHDEIGKALLSAAINTLGFCPLTAELLPIPLDSDPEEKIDEARAKVNAINDGEGVLLLTDIYGSTPSNIACSLLNEDLANNSSSKNNIRVISGINLPMLIRVLNYPTLSMEELVLKAVSGGKEGIMACDTNYE